MQQQDITLNDYLLNKARRNLTSYMVSKAARMAKGLGFGYAESPDAPNTYETLKDAFKASSRTLQALPVFDGGSENTIYTSKEGNWAFRFIHDVGHVTLGADFTIQGEAKVAQAQAEDVARYFGRNSLEHRLYMADTLGQVAYFAIHGDFPKNQLEFVKASLQSH